MNIQESMNAVYKYFLLSKLRITCLCKSNRITRAVLVSLLGHLLNNLDGWWFLFKKIFQLTFDITFSRFFFSFFSFSSFFLNKKFFIFTIKIKKNVTREQIFFIAMLSSGRTSFDDVSLKIILLYVIINSRRF